MGNGVWLRWTGGQEARRSVNVIRWLLAALNFMRYLRNHDWRRSGWLLRDLHGRTGYSYRRRMCVEMFEGGLEGQLYTGSTNGSDGGEGTSQGNLEVAVT